MGQCYELGATINPDCGHAMRVDEAGGACVCPTCGVRCEGRFEACGPILQRPGYVPVSAPQWAIDCVDPVTPVETIRRTTRATEPRPPATNGTPPAVDPGVIAMVRSELEHVTAELLGAINAVRRDINGHGTNGHDTNGHGTNGHGTNGHDTNGHDTNGHDTNGHATNGHDTNGHDTNGHGPDGLPPLRWSAPPSAVEWKQAESA